MPAAPFIGRRSARVPAAGGGGGGTETIDFTGTNGDPWPSGFTFDTPSGSGPTTSIQSNRGRIGTSTAGRDLYAVRTADSMLAADIRMFMPAASAGTSALGVVARYASSTSCYRARVRYSDGFFQITRNGTAVASYDINTNEGAIASAWRVRLRVTVSGANALVQAKYWADSGGEPGTWTLEYTDTAPLSAGKNGIYADMAGTANTFDVDDYVREAL